jgi:hypothetical protein
MPVMAMMRELLTEELSTSITRTREVPIIGVTRSPYIHHILRAVCILAGRVILIPRFLFVEPTDTMTKMVIAVLCTPTRNTTVALITGVL